jgi:methionyl-tRNA formyltransferase
VRIIFCGTPEFAVPSLRRLIAEPDFSVEAVITQPDRPRGRGGEVSSSPVKKLALEADLHVYQPETIKSESAFEFIQRIGPDAVVIIAYGQIIPARLLEIPRLGWINLHGSLLPKYRGAAPIQWAIARGETRTGLTTMRIDAGMDTGPILLRWETDIGPDETAPELAARMAAAGAELIVETLRQYDRGEISAQPQDHSQATLAPLLKREDGKIDWSLTASEIHNRMRGFAPWPGAWTHFRGQRCHLWGRPAAAPADTPATVPSGQLLLRGVELYVSCGQGTWLRLEAVQLEGHKRVAAAEFAHGARLQSTGTLTPWPD